MMAVGLWPFVAVIFQIQVSSQLQCFECGDTFKTSWQPQTCQINATANPSRICNSEQIYCFVQRVTVKGILTKITRDCASECRNGCEATSFGITQITCTSCCDQDNCNTGNGGHPVAPRHLPQIQCFLLPCCVVLFFIQFKVL